MKFKETIARKYVVHLRSQLTAALRDHTAKIVDEIIEKVDMAKREYYETVKPPSNIMASVDVFVSHLLGLIREMPEELKEYDEEQVEKFIKS